MGTRSVSYETDELANLIIITVGETVDGLHKQLPLLDACEAVHGKGGVSKNSGSKWKTDVEYQEHSNATGLPTGYEDIDLTARGTDQSMLFAPAHVTAPFMSSVNERAVFQGDAESKAVLARRAGNVARALMRNFHLHSLSGGVAAFTVGGWATLNGTDYAGGYIEEDAHGSQGNTVGGLSKSTLSAVPAMNNYSYDFGSAMGSSGRVGILTTLGLQKERAANLAAVKWFLSQQGNVNAARVMHPYMQYTQKDSPDLVGPAYKIDGHDAYVTSDMPIAGTNTTSYKWSALALDLEAMYPCFLKNKELDGYFGAVPPDQQHSGSRRVNIGYIDCYGQWMAHRFDSTGLYYNGETF